MQRTTLIKGALFTAMFAVLLGSCGLGGDTQRDTVIEEALFGSGSGSDGDCDAYPKSEKARDDFEEMRRIVEDIETTQAPGCPVAYPRFPYPDSFKPWRSNRLRYHPRRFSE